MSGVPPPPLPAAGGSTNGMLPKPPGYVDITSSTPGGALPQHLKPPPQRKPLPPSYRRPQNRGKYRNSRSRCSCGRFFCYCLLIFLILLCAVAVVGAAFYIYFQPKLPAFHFQSLKIGHFLVSVKSDGTFLHSAVNATVQVRNPNGKIKYSYNEGDVTFFAVDDTTGDVDLGSTKFPGFNQDTKNTTLLKLKARLSKSGEMVDDTVGSRLKSQFKSKTLKFSVMVKTKLSAHIIGGITVSLPVKIACGGESDATLKRINSGSLPRCSINTLRWIRLH